MACITISIVDIYIHTNNKQYIYVDRSWTYRVRTSEKIAVTEDTIVYLTYAGSTAIHGTSFTAPSRVTIKKGKYYVEFEVKVLSVPSSYQQWIKTSGSTSSLDKCNTASIQILSYDSTPHYSSEGFVPGPPGKDCCAYYDETYKHWRDYHPTCMGDTFTPLYPGVTLKDGSSSNYDWSQGDSI